MENDGEIHGVVAPLRLFGVLGAAGGCVVAMGYVVQRAGLLETAALAAVSSVTGYLLRAVWAGRR